MVKPKLKLETLTERRRPIHFNEIIDVAGSVKRIESILNKRLKRHFLLIGPAGTGKTTTAWAIARKFIMLNSTKKSRMRMTNIDKQIECINASSVGIDFIKTKVQTLIDISGPNVIILDEFDGIGGGNHAAQHALRSIMEESEQKKSAKLFVLTGNFIGKIIEPIISRCGGEAFYFPKIPFEQSKNELISICKKDGVNKFKYKPEIETVEEQNQELIDFFEALYYNTKGDMRKTLKYLETLMEVTEEGKTLDISTVIVDLTTNDFFLQLDKILLDEKLDKYSDEKPDWNKFLDSISELVYLKDVKKRWSHAKFFEETMNWVSMREERFSWLTLLDFVKIIGEIAYRASQDTSNSIHVHINAMITTMQRTKYTNILEKIR